MSVVINEFEVVPAQQQAQQPQPQAAAAAPPGQGEIDEEIRRAMERMRERAQRLRAT